MSFVHSPILSSHIKMPLLSLATIHGRSGIRCRFLRRDGRWMDGLGGFGGCGRRTAALSEAGGTLTSPRGTRWHLDYRCSMIMKLALHCERHGAPVAHHQPLHCGLCLWMQWDMTLTSLWRSLRVSCGSLAGSFGASPVERRGVRYRELVGRNICFPVSSTRVWPVLTTYKHQTSREASPRRPEDQDDLWSEQLVRLRNTDPWPRR